LKNNQNQRNTLAILWDIENVTPGSGSRFVEGLLDYAKDIGKLATATAYGDWTKGGIRKVAESLADNGFELIHVPKARKNSADISLITHAIEMIYQYPHLKSFIIITGDVDFRPLLLTLRKHGLEIIIICDAKNASEDLLMLADDYKDYRLLLPDTDLDQETDTREPQEREPLDKQAAFDLLAEVVEMMYRDKRKRTPSLGASKVRMTLLNSGFDESKLGFSSWKKFVLAAAAKGLIKLEYTETDILLKPREMIKQQSGKEHYPPPIKALLDAIGKLSPGKKEWVSFSAVSNKILENNINIRKYGYNKLKKLVQAAEVRNLVESKNDNLLWSVRLL
jgi:uncharacterized LabA/DUF88 family protein